VRGGRGNASTAPTKVPPAPPRPSNEKKKEENKGGRQEGRKEGRRGKHQHGIHVTAEKERHERRGRKHETYLAHAWCCCS